MTETRPRPAKPGPATQDTTVHPFRMEVPEEDLVELRQRIQASRWPEQAYPNRIDFNEATKGGHFAAWEQPELISEEVRAAFRSLR